MEQTNYKKKSGLFIAIVIIAEQLIRFVSDIVMNNIIASQMISGADSFDNERYSMISRIISICITTFAIIFTFAMGYVFTKDKRKTMIFAGSVYFGKRTAGILDSLISAIGYSMSYTAFGASKASIFIIVGDIITIPLVIVAAYFAFTAFEGMNAKLEGSLAKSEMLLDRAKKRVIAAYFGSAVIIGILESVPSLIFAFVGLDTLKYGTVMIVVSRLLSWLLSVMGIAIIYLAGYRPYKNHIDAMAFISISGITGAISNLIASLVLMPCQLLLNTATESGDYKTAAILSAVTGAGALIALIPEILLLLYATGFFFSPVKISLFGQNFAAEGMQIEIEEAPCITEAEAVEIVEESSEEDVPERVSEE